MVQAMPTPKIKILDEGDSVLNIWPVESGYNIAVRKKSGEVSVILVTLDENKYPRIQHTPNLSIEFKENDIEEVETIFPTANGVVKTSTF